MSLRQLDDHDRVVLARIDARKPALLTRTLDWARLNTGSTNIEGLTAFAPILEDAFSELDADIQLIRCAPVDKIDTKGESTRFQSGSVLQATARPEAPVQVVLTGHYDTVYAPGTFEAITDLGDGRINGPGVADMKGGLVVMLEALQAFEAGPLKDRLGYRIVLSPDEETGNFASQQLIHKAATGAHIGMTYEPAMESGAMAGARKGSAIFDIVFHGKASHAGRAPEQGRNALYAAAQFITQMERLEHEYPGVTFNVGRLDGGGAVNIVPDLAIVRLGVRAPDQGAAAWTTQKVRATFDQVCERDGITGHIHGGFYRPPKPHNAAQAALSLAIAETGAGLGLSITYVDTGGVCEGNNVFAAGVPNIDTLGVRGGLIHSPAEFMVVESLAERAGLSALILNRLADGRIDAHRIHALMEPHHDA
ncbi:hydrolase [Asticcacaulis sp. AC402]|uniref:hydrolase n=1 Tax=Asticcacaulis sp. AC402 TaxID=1282361 RepID=UPI0003C40B6B|nr:hydrolase [Asticcacaulis sp. AC402]ESQ74273.1 hypothetical protein ABAC402_15005 [Asticcacaulis sp. AC402]